MSQRREFKMQRRGKFQYATALHSTKSFLAIELNNRSQKVGEQEVQDIGRSQEVESTLKSSLSPLNSPKTLGIATKSAGLWMATTTL